MSEWLSFWISGWDPKGYPLHGPFDESGVALSRTINVFVTGYNPEKYGSFQVIEYSAYAAIKFEVERLRADIVQEAVPIDVHNQTLRDLKAWRDLAERMKAYWDEGNQDSLGKIFVDLERLRLESEP